MQVLEDRCDDRDEGWKQLLADTNGPRFRGGAGKPGGEGHGGGDHVDGENQPQPADQQIALRDRRRAQCAFGQRGDHQHRQDDGQDDQRRQGKPRSQAGGDKEGCGGEDRHRCGPGRQQVPRPVLNQVKADGLRVGGEQKAERLVAEFGPQPGSPDRRERGADDHDEARGKVRPAPRAAHPTVEDPQAADPDHHREICGLGEERHPAQHAGRSDNQAPLALALPHDQQKSEQEQHLRVEVEVRVDVQHGGEEDGGQGREEGDQRRRVPADDEEGEHGAHRNLDREDPARREEVVVGTQDRCDAGFLEDRERRRRVDEIAVDHLPPEDAQRERRHEGLVARVEALADESGAIDETGGEKKGRVKDCLPPRRERQGAQSLSP